jgi:hypothetical protein
MPVVLRIGPYVFFFYSLENNEPPHIHVRRDKMLAKFWLDPVSLAYNGRYPVHEVRHLGRLVQEHPELLLIGMITSNAPRIEFNSDATDVTMTDGMLRVHLADGREIAIPLEYFPGFGMPRQSSSRNGRSLAGGMASTGRISMKTSLSGAFFARTNPRIRLPATPRPACAAVAAAEFRQSSA